MRDGEMTRILQKLPLSALHPLPPATEMADLFRLALSGWTPASAGTGLEALFDRMEAGR